MNYFAKNILKDDKDIEFVSQYLAQLDPCQTTNVVVDLGLGSNGPIANLAAGEKLFTNNCISCHTKGNVMNGPELYGQNSIYLLKTLGEFKTGQRPSIMMQGMVGHLERKQLIDVSAYLNSKVECK